MAPGVLPLSPAEGLTRHFPPAVHQGASAQLELVGKVERAPLFRTGSLSQAPPTSLSSHYPGTPRTPFWPPSLCEIAFLEYPHPLRGGDRPYLCAALPGAGGRGPRRRRPRANAQRRGWSAAPPHSRPRGRPGTSPAGSGSRLGLPRALGPAASLKQLPVKIPKTGEWETARACLFLHPLPSLEIPRAIGP